MVIKAYTAPDLELDSEEISLTMTSDISDDIDIDLGGEDEDY